MKDSFHQILKDRVLVFDGAMGTNLQHQNLTRDDFGAKEGCNEVLILTKPEAVRRVHESFLEAGCDVIETNTFGANRIVLAEYGLEEKTAEINEKAARLAGEAARKFSTPSRPRLVAGSVGPGSKLPSLGHIGFDELFEAYQEQIRSLVSGGVDLLLIETCQDLLQAKTAIISALEFFKTSGKKLPLMVQVTFEPSGTMLLGTEMGAVIATLEMFPVDAIGMNCATGPREMAESLRFLCEHSSRLISALPNAGLPENADGKAVYRLTPAELADHLEHFVRDFGVSIVGGCCGTTPEHLKAVVERVGPLKPKRRNPGPLAAAASLYSAVAYRQDPPPLLIGEQANANGSLKFKELLKAGDYDGMAAMAREAVKEGAHWVDVSVAFTGRDESRDMTETLRRMNQQVPLPVMIDTTDLSVMEAGLKLVSGKPVLNSVNLEDGEERLGKICGLAKKYGAALVALTIDEKGMARTGREKLAVARRIYDLAVAKYGLEPRDLFFDALTFAVSSGEEFRNAARETLEAVRLIKAHLPGVHTILGVSNISFGLATHARPVLNSVFLNLAVEAGLDAAIVHARKILPLFKIPEEEVLLAKRLIHNECEGGKDPLEDFLQYFDRKKGAPAKGPEKAVTLSLEEALKNKIIEGETLDLEALLDRVREKYKPVEIINQILLEAMRTVGDLFGAGKTQLPFVLKSAEVMKRAVGHLEKFMEKNEGTQRGKIVLATVKGDVHDIGKNLVDILLTNNGYRVINLGIKQTIDNILGAVEEHRPDAVGLSGLLVKSTQIMKEDLEEMNRRGIRLPVILGGAALTRKYVEEDLAGLYRGEVYYGQDAFSGLRIMDKIMNPDHLARAGALGRSRGKKMEAGAGPSTDTSAAESKILHQGLPPAPPFWGARTVTDLPAETLFDWIDKVALFRGQWQFRPGEAPSPEFEKLLKEQAEPLFETWKVNCLREKILRPRFIYGFFPCYSESNDLVVLEPETGREKIRFTFPRQKTSPSLCLADFFRPQSAGIPDVLALQLVTVGEEAGKRIRALYEENRYTDYLYLHGLSVEAAEALAEYVHAKIRTELGVAARDGKNREEILRHQKYQGARYSFGYPACPNLEDQAKLFGLIPAAEIGVGLSETFQLVPEQSTSAIVTVHPQARYFRI